MKKLIFVCFLFSILLGTAWAQPANPQTISRIRDATTPASYANVMNYTVTFPVTRYGLHTLSGTYFYDGRDFRWWLGNTLEHDDIAQTTYVPYVGAFLHIYDSDTQAWDRLDSLDIQLDGKLLDGLVVYSATGFWDLDNGYYRNWDGRQVNDETIVNTAYAPYVMNFNYAYDEASTTWRWLNVQSSLADDMPVFRNGLVTYSVMGAYDGAAIDMLRVGAVGELQVTDVATRPGEDAARDLRKVEITERASYTPPKETSGQILAVPVIVLAAKEIIKYPNYCIFMKNLDATNSLTDVDHQVSPDNTSWVDLTEPASCDTLATGVMCVFCVSGNAYRYVRVRATAAAVAADVDSVDVWITAQK